MMDQPTQTPEPETTREAVMPTPAPAPESSGEPQPKNNNSVIITAVSPLVSILFGSSVGVNIIAPLICWLIWKEEYPLVNKIGKNVLNSQISWTIYTVVALLSCFILIGMVLLPVVVIAWIVLSIINAVKVANGDYGYVMPFTITFLK